MNKYNFSKRSLDNLVGIHPELIKVMTEAIKNSPVDFTITCGVRTTEQQQAEYAKGRTVAGIKVTNCDGVKSKSNHQVKSDGYGYAVDLYAYPINVNDTVNVRKIADHIKTVAKTLGIAIEWGGDWKMRDYPHFELKR